MKHFTLLLLFSIVLMSCHNEPEYADPEAHEKTEQLQQRYAPFFVGTWYVELMGERQRYFERLTFQPDGKLNGMRKWQTRRLVTIDGVEHYTDWEEVEAFNGTFSGTWCLRWERDEQGVGHDRIILYAGYEDNDSQYTAYSHNVLFNFVNENQLRFFGFMLSNNDGWTEYQKGDAEPRF